MPLAFSFGFFRCGGGRVGVYCCGKEEEEEEEEEDSLTWKWRRFGCLSEEKEGWMEGVCFFVKKCVLNKVSFAETCSDSQETKSW